MMKVLVPVVDSLSHKYEIAPGFSESCSVCIIDASSNEVIWYKPASLSVDFFAMMEELKQTGVVSIITSTIQPMALKVLNQKGFKVYRSVGNDLHANLELFEMLCLPLIGYGEALNQIESFCGQSCATCKSVVCKN